jgi:hypothetical protein
MLRLSLTSVVFASMLIASTTCSHAASPKQPQIPKQFHGQWQGTLRRAKLPDVTKDFEWSHPARVRIDISSTETRVYFWINDKWLEIKPRSFGITVFDTNAVITSITSGTDVDGVWVETWSFALSRIDSHRLHASSHRQVNNKNLHRDHPNAAWAAIAFVVLERVTDADV